MMLNLFTLAAGDPASHVYNHYFTKTDSGMWLWSGNVGNLILSAIILIAGGLYVASKLGTGPETMGTNRYLPRSKFAHFIEVICVYLRDEIVQPLLKDRTKKMMPVLWTIFFFILVNNILGLIPLLDLAHIINPEWQNAHKSPIGGTATQNIWVTGALALIAAIFFNGAAIARLGVAGYCKHLTAEAPVFVWPIIIPIEFFGQVLIKPVALAMRLFANMTAGHILLATLLGFVFEVWNADLALKGSVTLISVVGATALMFLELFVAFLQAFVFMFLTTVFISLMDHHDEHHEHGHEHGHGHAHGHEHAHA